MLLELFIQNFGLCTSSRIEFGSGLNVVTGETGSGKSTIIETLDLLLGARADTTMVRQGADKALLEAHFEIKSLKHIHQLISGWGLESDEEALIVRRLIMRDGGSRSYINGSLVTLGQLKQLRPFLADFHGQFDQQKLMSSSEQLSMLDEWLDAETNSVEERYHKTYAQLESDVEAYARIGRECENRKLLKEELTYKLEELESAAIEEGEIDRLKEQESFLRSLETLQQAADVVLDAVRGEGDIEGKAASDSIKEAQRYLSNLREVDSSTISPISDALSGASAYLEEAAELCESLQNRIESAYESTDEVSGIDEINARLRMYSDLLRKYESETEEDLLRQLDQFQRDLDKLEDEDKNAGNLPARIANLRKRTGLLAVEWSDARKNGAGVLQAQITSLLTKMGAPHAEFCIEILPREASADSEMYFEAPDSVRIGLTNNGMDKVEFKVSMNAGEVPMKLKKIASGGELSRIMLALKSVAGRGVTAPVSSVFDEIDSGIGGETAHSVAELLKATASGRQVICATHLPAIAGAGEHHVSVSKHLKDNRTQIKIESLGEEARLQEIQRMLGGEKTRGSMEMAESLLAPGKMLQKTAISTGRLRRKGFTLVEVLVSIIVIGVMASVAFPLSKINSVRDKEETLRENLIMIRKGLQNYKDENAGYPVNLLSLVNTGHLPRVPLEPFGFSWEYRAFGDTSFKSFGIGYPTWEVELPAERIQDVRSGNTETAINGIPYASW